MQKQPRNSTSWIGGSDSVLRRVTYVTILEMSTTSKQYKNIGEDLWKGRAEKMVRFEVPTSHLTSSERRIVRFDVWRSRGPVDPGL